MAIDIQLLGRFCVRRGGEEIPPSAFNGRRARTLMRVLVTHGGALVSRDALAEALWPTAPPADPGMNIMVLVQRARRAIGNPALIATGAGGYAFAPTPDCVVDAEMFLQLTQAGDGLRAAQQPARAYAAYTGALELWSGEPLTEDAYEDWAQDYRARLLRARQTALEGSATTALETGDPALLPPAVSRAEAAVAQEPLRETAHLLLARALAHSGDAAGALAALQRLRERLADDLGLDPSPEADALQTAILRGELVTPAGPTGPMAPRPGLPATLNFIGRDREVDEALATLGSGGSGVVVIGGVPGSGKSRLIHEIAARWRRPVIEARAFHAQRDEPWSLARSLLQEALALDAAAAAALPARAAQALADVVPEIEDLRPVPQGSVDPEARRSLAFEGAVHLLQAVARQDPLLIADDLQWADATSLALLSLLPIRLPRVRLLLAHRSGAEGDVLVPFLTSLASAATVRRQTLPGLPAEALVQLLGAGLHEIVTEETDATPLAVWEVVRALTAAGAAHPDARGRWQATGPAALAVARDAARQGQRRAVLGRIALQDPGAQEVLSVLATLAREAPARLLARAACQDQATVLDHLEALARGNLVRLGEQGWAPFHDTITEAVVGSLQPAELGRLHGRIAAGLHIDGGAEPAELARHLVGAGDPAAAAPAFAQASRQSLGRYANGEAENLANRGLASSPDTRTRCELLETRAEARARRGAFAEARDDLRSALAAGGDPARILTALAVVTSSSDDYDRAADVVDLAVAEAGDDPHARATALNAAARIDVNRGYLDRAGIRAAEALALFQGLGDSHGVADVVETQWVVAAQLTHWDSIAGLAERAVRLYEDTGRLLKVGFMRANQGHVAALTGQPERGLAMVDEAIALDEGLGNPAGQAYALWHRGKILLMLGRVAEAGVSMQRALTLAERVGHREWTAGALIGLGEVRLEEGDVEAARTHFERCLGIAGRFPLMVSWAATGMALVALANGDVDGAERWIARASREGTPYTHLGIPPVQREIARLRADPDGALTPPRLRAVATPSLPMPPPS